MGLKNALSNKVVRKKMLFTLLILLIYRVGCFVPVPGLNMNVIADLESNSFFSVLSIITGGSLQNGTLFALGIIPFINAFIIMQLLSIIIPKLKELSQNRDKRDQLTMITKYVSILLAVIQGIGIVINWKNQGALVSMFGSSSDVALAFTMIMIIIYLTAGSCIVMWLADRVTEYGLGNGSSLIIFVGILAGFFTGIGNEILGIANDVTIIWRLLLYLAVVVVVFGFIVFIDLSHHDIKIDYQAKQRGYKLAKFQPQVWPMPVNAGGVMPIIFASSFLMFPQLIASFWPTSKFYQWWSLHLGVGSWAYAGLLALLIFFFAFFYAKIQFDPYDLARGFGFLDSNDNGKEARGFSYARNFQREDLDAMKDRPRAVIRSARGDITSISKAAEYLNGIIKPLTLFGAIFLAIISLIPSLVFKAILTESSTLVNAFSATGMLIVVSVAIEFDKAMKNIAPNERNMTSQKGDKDKKKKAKGGKDSVEGSLTAVGKKA